MALNLNDSLLLQWFQPLRWLCWIFLSYCQLIHSGLCVPYGICPGNSANGYETQNSKERSRRLSHEPETGQVLQRHHANLRECK